MTVLTAAPVVFINHNDINPGPVAALIVLLLILGLAVYALKRYGW